MGSFFRVTGFGLGLLLLFTLISNLLPQIEGERPQQSISEAKDLSAEQWLQLGESLFEQKGQCSLCHNELNRAPDLLNMDLVKVVDSRIKDKSYGGSATDFNGYLLESMIEPNAYVVPGFEKAGQGAIESPMPDVRLPPILLTDTEIEATLVYLNSIAGRVYIPKAVEQGVEKGVSIDSPKLTGYALFEAKGCAICHDVSSDSNAAGPGLASIGSRSTAEQLRQSIINPEAIIAEGYSSPMPSSVVGDLTLAEIDSIVSYLMTLNGTISEEAP